MPPPAAPATTPTPASSLYSAAAATNTATAGADAIAATSVTAAAADAAAAATTTTTTEAALFRLPQPPPPPQQQMNADAKLCSPQPAGPAPGTAYGTTRKRLGNDSEVAAKAGKRPAGRALGPRRQPVEGIASAVRGADVQCAAVSDDASACLARHRPADLG